jgi:hypothetical protein
MKSEFSWHIGMVTGVIGAALPSEVAISGADVQMRRGHRPVRLRADYASRGA